jgi:uncharacterized protein YsxB (DUF464 family)
MKLVDYFFSDKYCASASSLTRHLANWFQELTDKFAAVNLLVLGLKATINKNHDDNDGADPINLAKLKLLMFYCLFED